MLVEVKRVNKAEMTVVSSLDVSDTFDKNHRDVMESIRNIESTISTAEFSALNSKVGLQGDQRDDISQETLLELKSLETLVKMRIRKLMGKKVPYKEVYREVRKMVEEF